MGTNNNKSKLGIWLGSICVVGIAVFGLSFMLAKQKKALDTDTNNRISQQKNGPVVKAIKAGNTSLDKGLVLIGEARPFQSVTLYAKTSGYMNQILVDKGDKVKQGQLLATIISPETDQAYNAAMADMENKEKIHARDEALVKKEYISKEDAEASETAVKMVKAQVQSLKEQMAYKNLTAPFSGTITARYADPGALVQNATNSQTSAQPVVTLSQLDKVRIYIYVAQNDAGYLRQGYPVTISTTDKPNVLLKASITRIAGELDPKTRMMLVEIDMDNHDNKIIPGSYLQVTLPPPGKKSLMVPSIALVIKGSNYFIPVINNEHELHYQPVTVGKNDGANVEIVKGIQAGDLIGLNVSAELQEKQKVSIQL